MKKRTTVLSVLLLILLVEIIPLHAGAADMNTDTVPEQTAVETPKAPKETG